MTLFEPSHDDYADDRLADESFFTECAASGSDVLTCENDSITHSLNAFSVVVPEREFMRASRGLRWLDAAVPLLQSIAPPEDLCAPEVSMCLEGEEEIEE